MEDGGWRMEDGGCMEVGGWRIEDGGWRRSQLCLKKVSGTLAIVCNRVPDRNRKVPDTFFRQSRRSLGPFPTLGRGGNARAAGWCQRPPRAVHQQEFAASRARAGQKWNDGKLQSMMGAARTKCQLAQIMHKEPPLPAPQCAVSAHSARCGAPPARIARHHLATRSRVHNSLERHGLRLNCKKKSCV